MSLSLAPSGNAVCIMERSSTGISSRPFTKAMSAFASDIDLYSSVAANERSFGLFSQPFICAFSSSLFMRPEPISSASSVKASTSLPLSVHEAPSFSSS